MQSLNMVPKLHFFIYGLYEFRVLCLAPSTDPADDLSSILIRQDNMTCTAA